jgi:hypothetical protein
MAACGLAKMVRADSSGMKGAMRAELLPTKTFQATEASAAAMVSIASR